LSGNTATARFPGTLRDIVVTEYGIADLRGKPDAAVIEALLNISDSRFQSGLDRTGTEGRQIAEEFPDRSTFCR
jgi:acyl-CoA hydrolase